MAERGSKLVEDVGIRQESLSHSAQHCIVGRFAVGGRASSLTPRRRLIAVRCYFSSALASCGVGETVGG
jgi:hypothetical protein